MKHIQNNYTTMNLNNETSRKLNILSAVTGVSKSKIIDSLIKLDPKYENILKVTRL